MNDFFFVLVVLDYFCEMIVEDGFLFCFYMVNSFYFDVIVCRVGDIIIVILSESIFVSKLVDIIIVKDFFVNLDIIIGLGG